MARRNSLTAAGRPPRRGSPVPMQSPEGGNPAVYISFEKHQLVGGKMLEISAIQ
jgi:hypothetical protein